MTTTRSTRDAANSRRRFLKVAVLGSAAALASSVVPGAGDAAAAGTKRPARPKRATTGRPEAAEAEIAKQKRSTGDMLKTIRDYELPAGSELAFAFVPARAPKRGSGSGPAPTGGGAR